MRLGQNINDYQRRFELQNRGTREKSRGWSLIRNSSSNPGIEVVDNKYWFGFLSDTMSSYQSQRTFPSSDPLHTTSVLSLIPFLFGGRGGAPGKTYICHACGAEMEGCLARKGGGKSNGEGVVVVAMKHFCYKSWFWGFYVAFLITHTELLHNLTGLCVCVCVCEWAIHPGYPSPNATMPFPQSLLPPPIPSKRIQQQYQRDNIP